MDSSNKLTVSDLFDTNKVTGSLFAYNIGLLIVLVLIILSTMKLFIWTPTVIGYREPLSVARTNDPINMKPVISTHPTRSCKSVAPHPEPWDRWNPPRCGGNWTYDTR